MVCFFYEIPLQNRNNTSNYGRIDGSSNSQEAKIDKFVGFEENKNNSVLVNATDNTSAPLPATDENNKVKMSVNHVSTDAFKLI